jgi:hypothetical protein
MLYAILGAAAGQVDGYRCQSQKHEPDKRGLLYLVALSRKAIKKQQDGSSETNDRDMV